MVLCYLFDPCTSPSPGPVPNVVSPIFLAFIWQCAGPVLSSGESKFFASLKENPLQKGESFVHAEQKLKRIRFERTCHTIFKRNSLLLSVKSKWYYYVAFAFLPVNTPESSCVTPLTESNILECPLADLGGGQNFLNFMQCFWKFGKIVWCRYLWRIGASSTRNPGSISGVIGSHVPVQNLQIVFVNPSKVWSFSNG